MDDSPSSLVELEIEEHWFWWSGYPRDPTYTWRCQLAKTDGPEFYTKTAFPSLKPDIDIFGVPRRSRKQRGWYQVTVPSLGRPSERVSKRAHFRPPAKPSDIPPELFDGILEHLTRWDADRHDLARCASVCCYWNEKCQRRLFGFLRLNSRENALQLLGFMRTPMSGASFLVQRVHIRKVQAVSGTPWLHLMSFISDRAHKKLEKYEVSLKGPLPAGQRMRSIHHQLPRSLPSHFSRHIFRLSLTDIHFKKLDDLMHLVGEMPHLCWLECERVTWGSLPTALPRRRPRNELLGKQTILMLECGPRPVLEASVWLAASMRPRDRAFFSRDDLTHVASLARVLENGASTWVVTSIYDGLFVLERGGCPQLRFHDTQRDPSSPSPEWRIDSIVLDIRKPEGPDMAAESELDWTVVGRALSSFSALKRMIVGFDSREDMLRFEEEVAQVHLQRLSGSGMLRYALWADLLDMVRREHGFEPLWNLTTQNVPDVARRTCTKSTTNSDEHINEDS